MSSCPRRWSGIACGGRSVAPAGGKTTQWSRRAWFGERVGCDDAGGHHPRGVPGHLGRDQARALGVHAVHDRQPALRRPDRRRRVGARLVDPARRAARRSRTATIGSGLLVAVLALFLGVALLRAVGIVARRLGAGIMQYRMQAHSRRAVTRQYLSLPMEWHQRHPTGELLSNANSDVEAAWGPIAPLPMAVGTVAMMVIAVVQMFIADLVLAVVGLLVFPAVIVANLAYQRLASPLMTRAQELRAEVSEIAHESFDGAMVVKTLGREGEETDRFAAKARELRDVNIRAGRIRAAFDPTLAALPNVGVLVVLAVGVSRVLNGATVAGDVVTVAYLLTIVSFPIRSIGWLLGEFPRSVVGFRRVSRVIEATGEIPYGATPAPDRLARRPARGRAPRLLLRARPAAARGRRVHRRAGPHGRGRRRDRVRQEHADRAAGPAGRPRPRPDPASTASTCATSTAASWPASRRWCPQTAFLFDDTVRGNVTLVGGADVSDEQVWAALRAAQADGFVAALPEGARHPARRARHLPVRRPAAADLAGPRAGPPAAAAGARRRHVGGRPRGRGPHPRGAARRRGRRRDAGRGRLPQGHHRAGRRGRAPRRTAGSSTAAPTPSCWPAPRPTPGWSTPTSTASTRSATRSSSTSWRPVTASR